MIFNEWVIIYLNPNVLEEREALFSPCNASKESGRFIENDINRIEYIFANHLSTYSFLRPDAMLPCCPTDGQAEVLVKDSIPRKFITGIAVGNSEMARRVYSILNLFCDDQVIKIYLSPDVISTKWSELARLGKYADEQIQEFNGGEDVK